MSFTSTASGRPSASSISVDAHPTDLGRGDVHPADRRVQTDSTEHDPQAADRPNLRHALDGLRNVARPTFHLIAATVVTSAAGAGFWLVAARAYPEAVVGINSAAIGLASTAALFAGLGTDTAALDLLPRIVDPAQRARLIGAMSLLTLVGLAVAFPLMWPFLPGDSRLELLVPTGLVAAATAAGLLADSFAVGLGASGWTLVRATAQSVLKLLALVATALAAARLNWGISAAWALGGIAALAWASRRLRLADGRPVPIAIPRRSEFTKILRLTPHHLGAGALGQLPMLLAPVLALHLYGQQSAAHAYVGWMIAGVAFTVSTAAGRVSLSRGAASPQDIASISSDTLRFSILLGGAVGVAIAVGAPWVLTAFGTGFDASVPMVRIMLLALVPDAVTNVWMSRWRVEGRLARVTALNVAITSTMLALPLVLPRSWGVTALAVAWVAAQATGCVFIAAIRRRHPSQDRRLTPTT
jgi:O-antigen/teichoic acid export membrane protein